MSELCVWKFMCTCGKDVCAALSFCACFQSLGSSACLSELVCGYVITKLDELTSYNSISLEPVVYTPECYLLHLFISSMTIKLCRYKGQSLTCMYLYLSLSPAY